LDPFVKPQSDVVTYIFCYINVTETLPLRVYRLHACLVGGIRSKNTRIPYHHLRMMVVVVVGHTVDVEPY